MTKKTEIVKSAELDDAVIKGETATADPAGSILDIDDEALASVAGGCCPPGTTTAICSPCPPLYCY